MRFPTMARFRCAGALVTGLLTAALAGAAAGAPATATDGVAPTAGPQDAAAAEAQSQSEERQRQAYGKHVERVKEIKVLFSKLRQWAEMQESVQLALPGGGTFDLPREALDVDEETGGTAGPDGAGLDSEDRPLAVRRRGSPDRAGKAAVRAPGRATRASSGGGSVHVVKRGDTLWKIAGQYLGSSQKAGAIAAANGITISTPLRVGQELVIPGAGTAGEEGQVGAHVVGRTGAPPPPARKAARLKNPQSEPILDYASYEFKMYLIKAGDSLSKIAKQYYANGGGIDLIRRYNKLEGESIVLRPGAKLLIPLPKKKGAEDRVEQARKGTF